MDAQTPYDISSPRLFPFEPAPWMWQTLLAFAVLLLISMLMRSLLRRRKNLSRKRLIIEVIADVERLLAHRESLNHQQLSAIALRARRIVSLATPEPIEPLSAAELSRYGETLQNSRPEIAAACRTIGAGEALRYAPHLLPEQSIAWLQELAGRLTQLSSTGGTR